MTQQQIRQEFEKYMLEQADVDLRKNSNGEYFNYLLNHQFKLFCQGWLAAQKALTDTPVKTTNGHKALNGNWHSSTINLEQLNDE